jgi:signal transduction histidine kinase
MTMAPQLTSLLTRTGSRWAVAYALLIVLGMHVAAISVSTAEVATWINDLAWAGASLVACLLCARTARRVAPPARKGWRWIAGGCASWFVGQLLWNFQQLVLAAPITYPNVAQVFYAAFAVCLIVGILSMPEVRSSEPLTPKHLGNVGLVVCCVIATVILGLLEPASNAAASSLAVLVGAVHSGLLASTFLVALFALWTYRWNRIWTSMLLIVAASGVYSAADLIYSYGILTDSHSQNDAINAAWCLAFGFLAWSAHERCWLEAHPGVDPALQMLVRERWLEAVIPALLIAIMIIVLLVAAPHLTPRTLGIAAVVFIVFAIVLGVREAWIQDETQRLNDELIRANRRLAVANAELQASESRYRELNAQLERRVAERTTELGRAYGELESFAYAVAHDLKAPLRTINGFAHMLREHLGTQAPPDVQRYLDRIGKGALTMAELIDDLLAYSHMERRQLSVSSVYLPGAIKSALAHYVDEIQRRNVDVQLEVEPLTIQVDAEGLMLVLRNLIENALKYSRDVAEARLRVSARRNGDTLLLEVADNGVGFDMTHHEQIFRIFHRLHRDERYPGTGIGLALVRKAVQRMRGRVWARSAPSQGATFFVELPLVEMIELRPQFAQAE